MDTHTHIPDTGEAMVGDWGARRTGLRFATMALLEDYKMKRGLLFGGILVAALVAFELFNFSTTEFALTDVLGGERFLGIHWATILAVAFCGIDFAGLARLFTPERGDGEPIEMWYLLGAWFLGATLNAMATWWAVTLTLLNHDIGNEVLSREQILTFVPVLVAALVWLTRILIIGTFSVAGERLFSQAEKAVRQAQGPRPLGDSAPYAPIPAWPGAARIIGERQTPQSAEAPAGGGQSPPSDWRAARRGSGAFGPQAAAPVQPAPTQRPQPANSNPRYPRPAPKPSAASRPLAGFVDGDSPGEERWAPDDLPPFVRRATAGSGRPANGATGAKTIE